MLGCLGWGVSVADPSLSQHTRQGPPTVSHAAKGYSWHARNGAASAVWLQYHGFPAAWALVSPPSSSDTCHTGHFAALSLCLPILQCSSTHVIAKAVSPSTCPAVPPDTPGQTSTGQAVLQFYLALVPGTFVFPWSHCTFCTTRQLRAATSSTCCMLQGDIGWISWCGSGQEQVPGI